MFALLAYVVPLLFLGVFAEVYIDQGNGDWRSVVATLSIYVFTLLCSHALALTLSCIRPQRLGRVLEICTISLFLFFWTSLIALFYVGISSWGQIPTFNLIWPYLHQLPTIAETVGLRFGWIQIALALVATAFFIFVWIASKRPPSRLNFFQFWVSRVPALRVPLVVLLILLSLGSFGASYLTSPTGHAFREPISLMLVPQSEVDAQSTTITELRLRALRDVENKAVVGYPPTTRGSGKNVILITVDALRPDRMSAYGALRQTTPFLAGLVKDKGSFALSNTRATCAESMCGIVSLLNGRPAHLSPWIGFTLTDALKRAGYMTVAILGGDHANFYGLRDRLGQFDTYSDGATAGPSPRINDDDYVLERIATQLPDCGDKPMFLYVHLMSTHMLGKKSASFEKWLPIQSPIRFMLGKVFNIDAESQEEIRNFYDNGVLQADATITSIYEILRKKKCTDNAIFAVTGDHGEFLGEYGRVQHGATILDPVLRIPMIIKGMNIDLRNVSLPTMQEDFAPSVLSELNLPIPSQWIGKSLQKPVDRLFTFHSQKVWAGLIDHRVQPPLKYMIDRSNQTSSIFRLTSLVSESEDIKSAISNDQKNEWNALLLREGLFSPVSDRSKDVSPEDRRYAPDLRLK
jgi:glucan phosphoethanolaminetransferase (alkaline phosphatase superfamily)